MPKTAMFKSCRATEEQRYAAYEPGQAFVVCAVQKCPELPFGTNFETHLQTQLLAVNSDTCKMRWSAQLNFTKRTMAKGVITRGAKTTMKEAFSKAFGSIIDYAATNKAVLLMEGTFP